MGKTIKHIVQNRKPAHTRPGAPLKAEIIEQAAQLMIDLGIHTVPDLRRVVEEPDHDWMPQVALPELTPREAEALSLLGQGYSNKAIAKAMGESVRPITPGGSPDPSQAKPTKTDGPSAITASTFFVSDEFLTVSTPPSDNHTE